MRLSVIIFLCVFSVVSLAATKVYKWVDKEGNIHYSEQKPVNQEADTMRLKTVEPSSSPQPSAEESSEEPASEEESVSKAAAKKQLAQADQINEQRLCEQARANRDALNATVRVSRVDPETGEQVRMNDEERVNALQKAEQAIRDYCQ